MSLEAFFSATSLNHYYLQQFRQGDEAAMTYVYEHVREPLLQYGGRIVKDRFAVEDMVQEIMLKGWMFRERMESLYHIYCFMRLNLRWRCYAYYRESKAGPGCRMIYTDYMDSYAADPDRMPTCTTLA